MAGEKERLPYLSIEVDAFTSDELVEAMTTEEVGAYFLLLCKAWKSNPPCSLPNDDTTLAKYARLTSRKWSAARRAVLAPWKIADDGRLYQKRLVESRTHAAQQIEKKRLAGQKGGFAKSQKSSTATASLQHSSSTGGSKPVAEACQVQLQVSVSSNEETQPPNPLSDQPVGFRFIEINGASVAFDGNHEVWVAEFIRQWNQLVGVRTHDKQVLTHINLMALRDRLSEADWDWPMAFTKFPLYLPDGVWPISLGTFLEAPTVSKILDGKYERRTRTDSGRSSPTIGDGQRFNAEAAAKRGVHDF